jgi:hypothetical protein
MTRTRSGKTLTELLVMIVVLVGLSGMLAHAVQKVCAAAGNPPGPANVALSASLNSPSATQLP